MRRRTPRPPGRPPGGQPQFRASPPALTAAAMVLTAWPVLAVGALVLAGWPVQAAAGPTPQGSTANLAPIVDTRTWTGGGGHTYPGAQVPFGMVQWSPDTRPGRTNTGGYFSDGARKLDGYSLTHVSGAGCAAAGDVPILPMTGARPAGNLNAVTTSFTNRGEVAQAGYYSARSNEPKTITSQFTATPHTAFGRFTFPPSKAADFVIKLDDSELGDFASTAQVIGNNEITGSVSSGNFCGETKKFGHQTYKLYFDLTFSKPFISAKISTPAGHSDPDAVFVRFDTTTLRVIEAHVAISYVSIAGARLDIQTEAPSWNFAQYKAKAQAEWNTLLSKITVAGGTATRTGEFYSLLYKSFLQPNITSDVNGQYLGSDQRVHTLSAGQANQYGMFSGWDIYHSLAQLQAMLDPSAASDMAQSLVNYYAQNGILPQWGYLNIDNYVMTGDPSDAVIADYYAFGARHFDTARALADMLRQATTVNRVRPGEAIEARFGYLPQDLQYGCCRMHDYVSTLLEYDTADFALAAYSAALGDHADATMLRTRANNWVHVFDRSDRLLVGRLASGAFLPRVGPTTQTGYTEGNAGQYLWDVPNDYAGLFARLGGNARVRPELRTYLSRPNGRGRFAYLSDEFDLGEQFAPDYAGDPAETQFAVDNIRRNLYRPGPSGFPNNDDLGAESSQFIWEMLGLYPENPGSDILVFASPGFHRIAIHLPGGKTITIIGSGAPAGLFYVRSLTINGRPDNKLYVPFAFLKAGATMNFRLNRTPTSWGSAPRNAPPSDRAGD